MYNIKFNETKMATTNKIIDNLDIENFKKVGESLEEQFNKINTLMGLNKEISEKIIQFNNINDSIAVKNTPANNIDYKSDNNKKEESIADKIDDYKKDNIQTETEKLSIDEKEEDKLTAKKLLIEADKLDEENKPANNNDYKGYESEKKTGTDGALIDIKDILK